MSLSGKTALVLGAVKGIGKGIALDLAKAGANVVLTVYDWRESLPALERDLAPFGHKALILEVNLLDPEAIAGMKEEIARRFSVLDIFINNIERGGWPKVHGPYVPSQWDLELSTCLGAKWWVFDAVLPLLRACKNGCVINISSIAAMVGRSGPAGPVFNDGYAAANRGVSLLTETWARAGAPEVRVNEIMLGFVETRHGENTRGWKFLSQDQRRAILDHTLMARTGKIEDVIKAVRFLVENSPFMTGSVLRLDGGYVLGGDKTLPIEPGALPPSQAHAGGFAVDTDPDED